MAETPPERWRAVEELLSYFEYEHLPPDLRAISESCHGLAYLMAETLPDGQQLVYGLADLLRAKDCFVRAKLRAMRLEAGHDSN